MPQVRAVPPQGRYGGTDLVETLAPQVPQGLLQAEGQRLARPLHVHDEGDPKHVLVLVVRYLHPLHELWHGPAGKQPSAQTKSLTVTQLDTQ